MKKSCPSCRAPCAGASPPEVNVLFRDALALLFPAEIAKRAVELEAARAEHAAEQAQAAAARAAEEESQRAAHAFPGGFPGGGALVAMFHITTTAVRVLLLHPAHPARWARPLCAKRRG